MASSTEFFWRREGSKGASRSTAEDISNAIRKTFNLIILTPYSHPVLSKLLSASDSGYLKHINSKLQNCVELQS